MVALLLILAAVALLIVAAFPGLASKKVNPVPLAAALIVIAVLVMPRWDTLT